MSFLSRLTGARPEQVTDSVLRNLQSVFNTRKGYGSVVESFGLGEYDAMNHTTAFIDALMVEILATVKEYEPRIAEPAVTLDGRDRKLWVRFLLSGAVDGQPQLFYVDIDSRYRNIDVRRAT